MNSDGQTADGHGTGHARRACTRIVTYAPPGGYPGIGYDAYHAGRGTAEQRVLYADQQTGYASCRAAINLAMDVPEDSIDPSLGYDLTSPSGAGHRGMLQGPLFRRKGTVRRRPAYKARSAAYAWPAIPVCMLR